MSSNLGVTAAIMALKKDLLEAAKRKSSDEAIFEITGATVELLVTIEAGKSKNVGAKIWVLSAGAKHSDKSVVAHKMTINLVPIKNDDKESSIFVLGRPS